MEDEDHVEGLEGLCEVGEKYRDGGMSEEDFKKEVEGFYAKYDLS